MDRIIDLLKSGIQFNLSIAISCAAKRIPFRNYSYVKQRKLTLFSVCLSGDQIPFAQNILHASTNVVSIEEFTIPPAAGKTSGGPLATGSSES
jgi:hypothetical protein